MTVAWTYGPDPEFPGEEEDCADIWGTASQATWISVTETDTDTARYTVDANTPTTARNGTFTVAGETVTVNQEAAPPCEPSPGVSPSSLSFGSGSDSKSVTVQEDQDCSHSVSDNRDWITVSPSPVAGNGTVTVTVEANPGSSRTGTVTIGSRTVPVNQDPGCTYALSYTSREVADDAGQYLVSVTADDGCSCGRRAATQAGSR